MSERCLLLLRTFLHDGLMDTCGLMCSCGLYEYNTSYLSTLMLKFPGDSTFDNTVIELDVDPALSSAVVTAVGSGSLACKRCSVLAVEPSAGVRIGSAPACGAIQADVQ